MKLHIYSLVGILSIFALSNAIYKYNNIYDCYTDNGEQNYIDQNDENLGVDNDDNLTRDYNLVIRNVSSSTTYYENFDRNHYQKRNNGLYNPSNCYIPNLSNTMVGSSFTDNSAVDYYNNYVPPYYDWGTLGTDTLPINTSFTSMQLVNPTTSFPYCTFGLFRSTFSRYNYETDNIETVDLLGSGSVIGPNTVLTCAHCFYRDVTKTYTDDDDVVHDEYEDNFDNPCFCLVSTFMPGKNGSIELMTGSPFIVKNIYINLSYFNNPTFANDWAIIEFETNIGYKTGWNGVISGHYSNSMSVDAHGYPGDTNYHQYEDFGTVTLLESGTKIYNATYFSCGGMSGGGVKTTFTNTYSYICGVNVGHTSTYACAKQVNKLMVNLAASFIQSRGV